MKICSIEECGRKHYGRGYCRMHYKRWRAHGDPEKTLRPVPKTACAFEGCENRGPYVRGWCSTHYMRWKIHGSPHVTLAFMDPEEAFQAYAEPIVGDPNCLIWTGALNSSGYGSVRVEGRTVSAHRYAWSRERGPIPDGMMVDHICWNRCCVNIDHLRLATKAQNMQNRSGANRDRSLPRGVYRDGRGYRAEVGHSGGRAYIGIFPTVEEASAAAAAKRAILFGEFAGAA